MILKTNNRTINPTATIYDALNANLIPFRRPSILGINFSMRKALNARIVLNDNRIFVPGRTSPKILMHDGRAIRTSIKSNLFQPSSVKN